MKVKITKLTGVDLMQAACSATMRGRESKMTLEKIYKCRHSPIRTQMFWVEMEDIPTYVSVHFVRHKVGVEHYVGTNREDRGGVKADRDTPVIHCMLLNAQALMNMALKRLCGQASEGTYNVMQMIKEELQYTDPELAPYLVRECEYRNGICDELKCCGNLFVPTKAA